MIKRGILFFALVITINITVQAQNLTNDAPRQTISINTVPKKWLQIESGLGVKINKLPSYKTTRFYLPSLLARYGLSNKIEARLLTGIAYSRIHFWNGTTERRGNDWGTGSIQIGGKLNILNEKKQGRPLVLRPIIGLIISDLVRTP